MLKYAIIIDEEKGLCNVGLGEDIDYYIANGYTELDVLQSDIDNNWYLADKCPMKTDEEKANERKIKFNKDFFNTSLGYVRRKVNMATGETKDFLSDLLPTISMGLQMGQPVTIITYSEPDFTLDIVDWENLQMLRPVTAEFVQECFLQLSNDFRPAEVQDTEAVSEG